MNYYNEHDQKAAAWLHELIRAGHIAPGEVDTRDIRLVSADELSGFTQCHFFAGIGGWSLALRLAGWPDDQPVWTGSCPCPPFSCAGKKKPCPICAGRVLVPHVFRTGHFTCVGCGHDWFADGRHLWPEFSRLIRECAPSVVIGEQVAPKDGLVWLAGIRADLEDQGYGVGSGDLCAASVGAPHIRQRLFWAANASGSSRQSGISQPGQRAIQKGDGQDFDGMADSSSKQTQSADSRGLHTEPCGGGIVGRLADSAGERRKRLEGSAEQEGRALAEERGAVDGLVQPVGAGLEGHAGDGDNGGEPRRIDEIQNGPATTSSGWGDFYIVPCADGKSRRVESGLQPLAHGVSGRVGLLRGYGNAIVPQVAAEFIRAYREAREGLK